MKKLVMAVFILAFVSCSRSSGNSERLIFWTPTSNATQTPIVVEVTITPVFVQITTTPLPTGTATPETYLCVSAQESVYLRPSAGIDNSYPIKPLKNGEKVTDLGGRSGIWWFVKIGSEQGWVNSNFVEECQ